MSTQQTATTADTTTTDAGTSTTSTDTTTGGGAAATATDQTGTDATQTTPPWGDDFDPQRAWQTVQNQRRVESEQKRVIAEQQAKLDEIERAKLTEAERVKDDLDKAKAEAAKAKQDVLDARFESAAIAAGIPPERIAAARAVAGEFTTSDDSGTVSVDTAVFDRLKAEHDYLFGQQAAPQTQVSFGAAASQGPGGNQGAGLTSEQVAMANRSGIDPADFAKYAQRTKR